jgi:hypothetical protein
VWLVAGRQREMSGEVSFQHISCLDDLLKIGINLLLVSLALVTDYCRLGGVSGEKFSLTLLSIILSPGKVIVRNRRHIHLGDIDLCASGNNVSLVDTTKGDSIDFVRSRHKQEARVKCLQAHTALATESSSQNDQDGSICDGFPHTGRVLLNDVHRLCDNFVLGRVIARGLLL